MNSNELIAERVRRGKTRRYMAGVIGVDYDAYLKKEKGLTKFTPDQIIAVSRDLELNADLINVIFFDNKLPIGRRKKYS